MDERHLCQNSSLRDGSVFCRSTIIPSVLSFAPKAPSRASPAAGFQAKAFLRISSETTGSAYVQEVTPFEWSGGIYEIGSSQLSEYRRVYPLSAIFATQSVESLHKQGNGSR